DPLHATSVFLEPLEQLAIFDADPVPKLAWPAAGSPPGRWLAAHPGSGSEKKNWPESKWGALLHRVVAETSANLLLAGGEAESDRVRRLAAALPPDRVRLAVNLPLSELAAALATARGFLGHDSGITHLASALGLPALVLWGP